GPPERDAGPEPADAAASEVHPQPEGDAMVMTTFHGTSASAARQRAAAVGIWAAMAGVGVAIGPVAGGLLLEHYSWASACTRSNRSLRWPHMNSTIWGGSKADNIRLWVARRSGG